jgi:NADH-quinone oxidoreductase subunit J
VFPEAEERAELERVRKLNEGEVGDEVPSEPESTDLSGYGEEDKL